MDFQLKSKALHLKGILNKINDASYSYDQINKMLTINRATSDDDLRKLISSYDLIIQDLVGYLKTTNYGKFD